MFIDQISVFIENRQGRLGEITRSLGEGGIDIRALSLADTTNFGILRLIVADAAKAEQILKDAGFTVSTTKVIAVEIDDRPGGLANTLTKLGEAGISVEYAYAFITRKSGGAYVILRVEDTDAATACLQACGTRLLSVEDIQNI